MKHIKKIISFLTIICCLAGSTIPAYASGTGDSGGSAGTASDRVIFINEQEKLPYLVVSKTVVNQGSVEAPTDDVFTFTLERLEDRGTPQERWAPVVGQSYQVFAVTDTACANPIPTTVNGVSVKNRSTKSGGTFELKDGQKARFKLDAEQSYRVSENSKKNYTRNPESQTVDMELKTETIDFVNTYKVNPGTDDFRLQVEKKLQFPGDYTAPQTPEFTFQLKIKTQLTFEGYGGQSFTVKKNGKVEYTDATKSDGTFRLKAGYTAEFDFSEFSENYSNARYQITELKPSVAAGTEAGADLREDWENWWTVEGSEEREGRVDAGATETFTNANVSFAVHKQLKPGVEADPDPDAEFTFLLTDGSKAWADAPYYLYDEWGNRINNTPESGTTGTGNQGDGTQNTVSVNVHKTDDKGKFTLKFGQSALFLGIRPGTYYTVTEDVSDGYKQSEPTTAQGLPDGFRRWVQKAAETVTFSNEPLPETGLLVAKELTNPNGEYPGINAPPFKFRLMEQVVASKEDPEAEKIEVPANAGDPGAIEKDGKYVIEKYVKYKPVAGATYNNGKTNTDTGTNGSFELAYGTQALFEALTPGKVYRVVEVLDGDLLLEYDFDHLTVKSGEDELEIDSVYEAETQRVMVEDKVKQEYEKLRGWQAELPEGKRVSFLFTNSYKPNRLELELTKIDPEGKVLKGAIFTLYEDADLTKEVKKILPEADADGNLEISEFETDENGTLTFENLTPRTYWLKEIKAPSGYSLIPNAIEIKIDVSMEGDKKKITVTINGNSFVATGETEVETKLELVPGVHAVDNSTKDDENDLVKIKVRNIKLYELPSSGGIGIYWYSIGGILLMMAAALILYRKKHVGGGAERLRE